MSSMKRLLDGHEPECGYSNNADWEGCICQILREAYRRGRKDAAEAAFEWLTDDTRHTDQSLIDACTGDNQ